MLVRRAFIAALVFVAPAALVAGPVGAAVVSKPSAVLRHVSMISEAASRELHVEAQIRGVSVPVLRAQWQRVAVCEVGGNWSMTGPSYSGIGFANSTWYQYGGRRFAPLAGEATRDQQILVGMRVTHGWVPDQEGCSPTGW
jgi:hypothetical protein